MVLPLLRTVNRTSELLGALSAIEIELRSALRLIDGDSFQRQLAREEIERAAKRAARLWTEAYPSR